MAALLVRANGFVYSADADADADFVYAADSVLTCDDWYTDDHFFAVWLFLTVFDDWYTIVTLLVQSW